LDATRWCEHLPIRRTVVSDPHPKAAMQGSGHLRLHTLLYRLRQNLAGVKRSHSSLSIVVKWITARLSASSAAVLKPASEIMDGWGVLPTVVVKLPGPCAGWSRPSTTYLVDERAAIDVRQVPPQA
jgi:hypothetical protein